MTIGYAGYGNNVRMRMLHNSPMENALAADHRKDQRNVPPVEEYQAWLDSRPKRGAAYKIDAARLRRIVIGIRGGESFAEIWRAMGKPISRELFRQMPDHLK